MAAQTPFADPISPSLALAASPSLPHGTLKAPPLPVNSGSYLRDSPASKKVDSSRRLCLFFDGTGNTFGENVSNIPTLFGLSSEDPSRQLCYYQTGVGTQIVAGSSLFGPSRLIGAISNVVDAGIAYSLGSHIQAGYKWLMNTYLPGDQIYILGFSRGAFTARALAGMLQQVGLLPSGNEESVPLAYSIYKSPDKQLTKTQSLSDGFKLTFSREVRVHFVGVFDTVSSVGALYPRTLPFAGGSNYISVFRQCCSLDERRARYQNQPWISEPRTPDCNDQHPDTDVREVWFSGSHSNVGGGEFPYDGYEAPSLSFIPLRWMIREAVLHGFELDTAHVTSSSIFADSYQEALRIDPSKHDDDDLVDFLTRVKTANPAVNETVATCIYLASKPSASMTADALAPRGNHLSFKLEKRSEAVRRTMGFGARFKDWLSRVSTRLVTLGWWILEVLPTPKVIFDVEGNTRKWSFRSNFGRGRRLPPHPSFHFTVKQRLDAHATEFAVIGGGGNNENFPEGEHYHYAAKLRKGGRGQEVNFVE